jgi:hypothetical protein
VRFHDPYWKPGQNEDQAGKPRLLGFIRYSKEKGILELTNFRAKLGRKALKLGFSTKRQKAELAGTHGEGFKVASLVMLRKGYHVHFDASKFYWNFHFAGTDKDTLYCFFSAPKDHVVQKQMDAYKKRLAKVGSRELKTNIWEDVSVKIGKVPRSQGAKIDLATFNHWLKASLDLDRPTKFISTGYGRLIMDPNFRGRIYLKGLLLETNSARGFRFGYDLAEGKVNRDRQRLKNPEGEANVLARIWEEAIQKEAGDTIKEYVDMLRDRIDWADVILAKDHISEVTAKAVWQHLLEEDPERKLFYHDHKNADEV